MENNDIVLNIGDIPIAFSSRRTFKDDSCLHCHEFVEAFLIETGTVEHEIDGVRETLKPGDCRILFPGVAHRFIPEGNCVHRDFLIRNDFYNEIGNSIDPEFFNALRASRSTLIHVSTQDILYLEEKNILFFDMPDSPAKEKMERAFAMNLLLLFYTDGTHEQHTDPFTAEASDLIDQYFTYPDAAKRIRGKMSYNDKYFCKKFREAFDVTFLTYINRKKMEYAKYLLQMTGLSMEEICASVGIESVSYFHKIYMKTFGETPSKTRKAKKAD